MPSVGERYVIMSTASSVGIGLIYRFDIVLSLPEVGGDARQHAILALDHQQVPNQTLTFRPYIPSGEALMVCVISVFIVAGMTAWRDLIIMADSIFNTMTIRCFARVLRDNKLETFDETDDCPLIR
eukprot:scaffold259276_cov22-Prasinocladus_malaysianus.AAC.1